MSQEESGAAAAGSNSRPAVSDSQCHERIKTSVQALSSIVPNITSPLAADPNAAASLLHDSAISFHITALLQKPNSGAGDNNLCRWLYDTFQTTVPELQLVVLRFVPTVTGLYLCRIAERKPQAGFEAVLLALYAHETANRNGQAVTINIPDLSYVSVYHEAKQPPPKSNSTKVNMAVVSPSLEPHGTVRSTRRARIVGVALELYYTKIADMPVASKIEFCEFCKIWAGQDGDMYREGGPVKKDDKKVKEGRILLPWDLMQPVLRILGHCLMGPDNAKKELFDVACDACRCLYARSLHDINPKAILATGSLLKLLKTVGDEGAPDPTDLPMSNVISA